MNKKIIIIFSIIIVLLIAVFVVSTMNTPNKFVPADNYNNNYDENSEDNFTDLDLNLEDEDLPELINDTEEMETQSVELNNFLD